MFYTGQCYVFTIFKEIFGKKWSILCYRVLCISLFLDIQIADPAIYLDTLRRLNLKPEEVIAIEDSTYGIQACIGANIRVIAKEANRYDFNQDLADVIASDILDAYNIIKYWNLEENYFFV